MGSCLGSCVASSSKESSPSSSSSHSSTEQTLPASSSCLWRRRPAEQDAELLSNTSDRCRRRGLIYRILKFKSRPSCHQFLNQGREQPEAGYAKLQHDSGYADIQLQHLDVYSLLQAPLASKETELQGYQRIASSRASSSLDLEWEHEYSQLRQYQQQQQQQPRPQPPQVDQLSIVASRLTSRQPRTFAQRHGSMTRTSCCSSTQHSWSHISTPESLEWDIDAEQEQQRQLRLEDDNLDDETLQLLHQIEQLKNHVLQETGDGQQLSEGLQLCATHFGPSPIS